MPFHDYGCNACQHVFETFQKMSDDKLLTCPVCGEDSLYRMISAPNVRVTSSGPDVGKLTRDFHGVEKGAQIFTSPFTGEDLDVSGSTRHAQNVVAQHYQTHGQDISPDQIEPMNK